MMQTWKRGASLVTLLTGMILGIGISAMASSASANLGNTHVGSGQAPPPPQLVPAYRGLDANVYMQTAAEYRACCLQTYNLAFQALKDKVEKAPKGDKTFAIVSDLDETILDNAGFQTLQVKNNIGFDTGLWNQWQEKYGNKVTLIPGAKEFIQKARKLGVAHVYISNRDHAYHDQTKAMLKDLGIGIEYDNQLKLLPTGAASGDKTVRRQEAEAQYQVLIYLGDNLRDFDESFKTMPIADRTLDNCQKAIAARKKTVDDQQEAFGTKWFIFPNPVYGEWPSATLKNKDDEQLLVPPPPELK
ncbi:MAG: HAD family acid phosphatase [Gemmatales bacterium]